MSTIGFDFRNERCVVAVAKQTSTVCFDEEHCFLGVSGAATRVLEKDKLTGLNYVDWLRNLRIVLRMENKQRAIEEPLLAAPAAGASRAIREEYEKRLTESNEAACLILCKYGLFLAPKTVFLLPKIDNFLQKTDLQHIRQEEYFGRSRKLILHCSRREGDGSRREDYARAAKKRFAPRNSTFLDWKLPEN
ncbi:hypothetical protein OSB04_030861 [Centaurea solstitialis]|uniref:Uncharacterized protein n=1 Tax=Centaurea solstitialis TaxID=347529 RepID=A0AA38SFZ1_9ASTR|nr:hypothetical protein OSB04_030861 [Centaurea solstitialis]